MREEMVFERELLLEFALAEGTDVIFLSSPGSIRLYFLLFRLLSVPLWLFFTDSSGELTDFRIKAIRIALRGVSLEGMRGSRVALY